MSGADKHRVVSGNWPYDRTRPVSSTLPVIPLRSSGDIVAFITCTVSAGGEGTVVTAQSQSLEDSVHFSSVAVSPWCEESLTLADSVDDTVMTSTISGKSSKKEY